MNQSELNELADGQLIWATCDFGKSGIQKLLLQVTSIRNKRPSSDAWLSCFGSDEGYYPNEVIRWKKVKIVDEE